MKKSNGASLAQYGIVITLVCLAIIPIYFLLGQNIKNALTNFYNYLQDTNYNMAFNSGSYKGGMLGGTSTQPQSWCYGGNCAIDYGEFVLRGVPENFQNFVETTGTSGGTDKIIDMIEQIAQQMQKEGDTTEAKELMSLANLGHYMGALQNKLESTAKTCTSESDPLKCYKDFYKKPVKDILPLPANIESFLPEFDSSQSLGTFISYNRTFIVSQKMLYNQDVWEKQKPTNENTNVMYKMISILNNMKGNDKYSETTFKVANTLTNKINTMQDNFFNVAHVPAAAKVMGEEFSGVNNHYYYDPKTDQVIHNTNPWTRTFDDFSTITNPKTSVFTDIRSQMICITGKYDDDGKKCK